MPLSLWDIGGCNCPGGTCNITLQVFGCNNLPYASLTAQVYDHAGGTLLGTATTDAVGKVSFAGLAATSPVYVVVTGQSARFAAFAQTVTVLCNGTVANVHLVPASGFVCPTGLNCLLPVKTTLTVTVTGSLTGTGTSTWGGSSWSGISVAGGVGGWTVAPNVSPLTAGLYFLGSLVCNSSPSSSTCPPGFTSSSTYTSCGGGGSGTVSISE